MRSPFRSPAALARFFLVSVAGIALDLWSKWYAFQQLAMQIYRLPNGKVEVISRPAYQFIPGWLHFEVTPNQGAVFGQLQGYRILFVIMSVAAMAFLTWLFATSGKRAGFQILLGMLLAGVIGNLYDRMTLGYVRDMIHALPRWPHLYPWIFNVADILLCLGVGSMVLYSLFSPPPGAPSDAPHS
jgi:signal peptidase II